MINSILDKYINNEKGVAFTNYTPEGIKQLLKILGDPHENLKTIHVAGTNGKGTTCHILASVLKNSGYKTGLFISPHLLRINERISINSSEITDNELHHYVSLVDHAATNNNIPVTYFDILTAASLCYFNHLSTDIAIIETGLGGRLDSTNIITPEISIITDISTDHTHILGDTIEKITEEKCGIIKPGTPVVTTNNSEIIREVISRYAALNSAPLYILGISFQAEQLISDNENLKFIFSFNNRILKIETPLFFRHQIKNSAASSAALMILKDKGFKNITPDIIISTMKDIVIPGRFEKLSNSLHIYFDPAHNISALSNLLDEINKRFTGWKILFIITLMRDKATLDVIQRLWYERDNIIYYNSDDARAYNPEDDTFSLVTGNRDLIIKRIKSENLNNTVIIFTGTFRIYHFALEIAKFIENKYF